MGEAYKQTASYQEFQAQKKALKEAKKVGPVVASKKVGKKPKDVNAPKRPSSSYFLYVKEIRPQVAEENPGAGLGQIGKIMGQMWHNLVDEVKAAYTEKAEVLKQKYQEESAAYKTTDEYASFQEKLAAWKSGKKQSLKPVVEEVEKKNMVLRK